MNVVSKHWKYLIETWARVETNIIRVERFHTQWTLDKYNIFISIHSRTSGADMVKTLEMVGVMLQE